jgi:hypothetical protein
MQFTYTWISLPDEAGRRPLPSHLSDFRRGERQILGFAPTSVGNFSKLNADIFSNRNVILILEHKITGTLKADNHD